MRKKKVVVLLLSLSLAASALSACGASKNDVSDMGTYYDNSSNDSSVNDIKYEDIGIVSECEEEQAAQAGIMPMQGVANYNMKTESADGEMMEPDFNTEEYSAVKEEGFKAVVNEPLSTFSADVDTASYSNLRRMIEDGYSLEDIPAGAVRIEEMLNYFSYDYNLPKGNEPFGVTTVMGDCPWNEDAKLLQIGLKTEEIDFSEAPASNLVFLLDVSGSMYTDDKLPLLQKSFTMLTEELTEKDRVSIVTYAGSDDIVLEGASGDDKKTITAAINSLEANGSTNGSAGIETAYELAEEYFIEGGNNRIILATDGDLNVGVSSESELKDLVTEKRESGVFLSVLGFGTGNIKDNKMETLADNGNGNYAYIDSIAEAKKTMVEEMGATLVTVAKDVKFQIEFNPAYVKGYRLLGYENRALATEDFDDDKKDAGEIGAGHMVTALYEIIPADSKQKISETELKYQNLEVDEGAKNGEWMNLKIRYKEPDADKSKLLEYPITEDAYQEKPNADFNFAAAVAEFGLILRDSEYKGDASFKNVRELLDNADTSSDDYKDEFDYLVKKLERQS